MTGIKRGILDAAFGIWAKAHGMAVLVDAFLCGKASWNNTEATDGAKWGGPSVDWLKQSGGGGGED